MDGGLPGGIGWGESGPKGAGKMEHGTGAAVRWEEERRRLTLQGEEVLDYVSHDKKCEGSSVSVVYVPEVGRFELRTLGLDEFRRQVRPALQALQSNLQTGA